MSFSGCAGKSPLDWGMAQILVAKEDGIFTSPESDEAAIERTTLPFAALGVV